MPYDELVKRLRERSVFLFPHHGESRSYDADIMHEAADVIEELKKKIYFQDITTAQILEMYMPFFIPKWIPVTERLPEDGKFVLVCNDDGKMMIAKHETETYEWYYKYTNYDFDIWDNEEQGPVRYWMPLPEPPKEG